MTSPVPAGAGGVDRDDLVTSARKRAAELMDNLRETQAWRDGATMLALASELRALRAALAAAEQRAETAEAAILDVLEAAEVGHRAPHETNARRLIETAVRIEGGYQPGGSNSAQATARLLRVVAALSSRPVPMDGNHISIPGPVQPDTERSET